MLDFRPGFCVCTTRGIIRDADGLGFALSTNKAALLLIAGAARAPPAKGRHSAGAGPGAVSPALGDRAAREKGKVICRTPELASVALKQKPLSNSEVIVTNRRGEQRVFGILNPGDFRSSARCSTLKDGERFSPLA